MRKLIKRELKGVESIILDLAPRVVSLLDPRVWQNTESIQAGLVSLSTSFVADRIRKLLNEISGNKKIDTATLNSEESTQSLIDVVKFAVQNPEEEVWESVKRVFIKGLETNTSERERRSLHEMISVCKQLSATEILILRASYNLMHKKNNSTQYNPHSSTAWAENIAKEIGLETREEVLRYEENLTRHRLIVQRESLRGEIGDLWIGNSHNMYHRLTPFGINLVNKLAAD